MMTKPEKSVWVAAFVHAIENRIGRDLPSVAADAAREAAAVVRALRAARRELDLRALADQDDERGAVSDLSMYDEVVEVAE